MHTAFPLISLWINQLSTVKETVPPFESCPLCMWYRSIANFSFMPGPHLIVEVSVERAVGGVYYPWLLEADHKTEAMSHGKSDRYSLFS